MIKLRKMIVLSLTLSSMLGMAQTAFGAETTVDTRNNISSSVSLVQANTDFPSEEKLKEVHNQMINKIIKEITGAPKANKRIRRSHVIYDSKEQQHNAKIGDEFTSSASHRIRNLIGEVQNQFSLETTYRIYSGRVDMRTLSIEGTYSTHPYSISTETTMTLDSGDRTASTKAEYVLSRKYASHDTTYTIKTTVIVKYADKGTIVFTVRSVIEEL